MRPRWNAGVGGLRRGGQFCRNVPAAVILALTLGLGGSSRASPPSHLVSLSGIVRDQTGRLLAGSVLLLSSVEPPQGVRTTSTSEDGTFLFTDIPSGIYRLAAVKTGYVGTVARVNTIVESSVDFVLNPAAPNDPELARDKSWMLRVPPRDILRDLDLSIDGGETSVATSVRSGSDGPPPVAIALERGGGFSAQQARAMQLPVDGEVQQWFSSESPMAAASPVSDSTGTATAVRLAVRVGERINVRLSGNREREDALMADGPEDSQRSTAVDRLGLTLGYELGTLSRIDMQAYYGRDAMLLNGDEGSGFAGLGALADGSNVTRACRTSWRREIEGGSLDVSALYADSEAFWMDDPFVNRLWRAGGQFQSLLGEDHKVSIGLRARLLELSEDAGLAVNSASFHSPLSLAGPEPPGWALHLHGAEEWSVAPSLAFLFGFDYHRSLAQAEATHFVPQAGAALKPTRQTTLKATVSYLEASRSSGSGAEEALEESPVALPDGRRRIGYELTLERVGRDGSHVALSANSRPIAYAYEDESTVLSPMAQRPVYVTDGQAQTREIALEMQRRFGWLTAGLTSAWGEVEGRYASSLASEPLWQLRDGTLRYVMTSLRGLASATGTEFRIEMRTLRDAGQSGSDLQGEVAENDRDSRLKGLSFLVAQELPFIQLAETRWRFLLAFQNTLDSGASQSEQQTPSLSRRALLTAENRMSGGVSVQF